MKKINGTPLIEMAQGDHTHQPATSLSKLVGAACDRFFASRGMTFEFKPGDLDSLGRRKHRWGRK